MKEKPHWITRIAYTLGAKYALWKEKRRRSLRRQNIVEYK